MQKQQEFSHQQANFPACFSFSMVFGLCICLCLFSAAEKLSINNRQQVAGAQRAEREKQQAEHTARVAQTKAAREKQLQKEQDRKDKVKQKVQKRERRR